MTVSRRDFLGQTLISAGSLTTLWLTLGAPNAARADTARDPLTDFVEQIRAKHGVPGLAVLVQNKGTVDHLIATGTRARGSDAPVTAEDLWHIGSCLKAMTATLLARLVEKGSLAWDSTVASVFPELAPAMNPVSAKITLDQLLSMSAGLAENPSNKLGLDQTIELLRHLDENKGASPRERRMQVVKTMLAGPPHSTPGTKAAYSNTGYIIAGAMAEQLTGTAYETLLADEVLQPLGITHFGFGAPGRAATIDQPRGHKMGHNSPPLSPDDPEADLPTVFRPAGGLHISLRDWAVFVSDVLAGIKGKGQLLKPETYGHLLASTHLKPLGVYASGWAVLEKDGKVEALAHTGSNLRWFASVNAYPPLDLFFLIVTNDGRPSDAEKALGDVRSHLKSNYGLH